MNVSPCDVKPVDGVEGLSPYLPGKPIEEVERELGISDICKLASNENPYGPSPLALEACRSGLQGLELYPDANSYYLKAALSEYYGIDPERLVIGNGSNELITVTIRTLVSPGDEVIVSEYGFFVYGMQATVAGASVVTIQERDWCVDAAAIIAAITPRTRLICLANPNNPTGTWLGREELKQLLDTVPSEVAVLLDEAYFEYVTEAGYPDGFQLQELYPNLIVCRTFSKMYGLAGLRVGYAVANPRIIDFINRVRDPFNVNLVAQRAAIAALTDEGHVIRGREGNLEEKRRLEEYAVGNSLSFIPSAGNFVSVEFGFRSVDIYRQLLSQGIIVRPIANYGMPNHLRITLGRPEENTRLFAALDELLPEA
jgi:histidinol-phosphate aminotransferase